MGGRRIVRGQLEGCESLIVCVCERKERSFVSGRFSEFCYAFASAWEYHVVLRDELFALFSFFLSLFLWCVVIDCVWCGPLRDLVLLSGPSIHSALFSAHFHARHRSFWKKRKSLQLFVWLGPGSEKSVRDTKQQIYHFPSLSFSLSMCPRWGEAYC